MNKRATRDLFNVIVKFVQARRAAGAPTKDTIDALIQKGEKDIDIVTVGRSSIYLFGFDSESRFIVLGGCWYFVRWYCYHRHHL